MILDSLHNLILEKNVLGYCFSDWDGIPVKSEGSVPEALAPLVVQLLKVWSGDIDESWREIRYTDNIYHICAGEAGVLVVLADAKVNVGLMRLRAGELFGLINEKLHGLFDQREN